MFGGAAHAAASPGWKLLAITGPTNLPPNGNGEIAVLPSNVGSVEADGALEPITVHLGPLPTGIVTAGQADGEGWSCLGGAGEVMVNCASTGTVAALTAANPIAVPVEVTSDTDFEARTTATISGGGGASEIASLSVVVSSEPAKPGIAGFWAGAFDSEGRPSTQAGGHAYSAAAEFAVNTVRLANGALSPAGDLRDVYVHLPPGFLGNPLITGRCPQSLIAPFNGDTLLCNREALVGEVLPRTALAQSSKPFGVYNDVPAFGNAAQFGTRLVSPVQSLLGSLRSDEDFGVTIEAPRVATFQKVFSTLTVLYGRPQAARGKAFLVNPTDCAQQREESEQGRGPLTRLEASSWQHPTEFTEAVDFLPLLTGCQALTEAWLGEGADPRKPSFGFEPTTTQGSSGTGAVARLHVPQEGLSELGPGGAEKLATADLKKAVVTLPQGLTLNPSSANGLEACSETQMGYGGPGLSPNPTRFNEEPVTCPDGSKLGTFQIKTPLLEEEVEGTIYLAAQEENPFHSLIALYLVVENERFGVTLKLPGEVRPDPTTGQLTAAFDNNPQVPFEDLTLRFRGGGPRSELATPEVCGHYETTSVLTPWSAEAGQAVHLGEAGFDVGSGCAGSAGGQGFAPSFEAGTIDPVAGAYSPLVVKINRKDGEQALSSLDFTLPEGLVGRLAGIPYCPDASIAAASGRTGKDELGGSSCPAASQIGTVDTAAGVGSEPIHVGGKVFLAGPYKGAPLSAVVITPAVAGPFDLGNVVVRAPLEVNPETAQITTKSDPIPTILKGIPLKLRSVVIKVDRSGFTLNPTSCEPMSVTASLGGSSGATAKPSNHFQVGGCNKLKFKPKLKLSLKGSTKRIGHPALKAVLTYPKHGAYANVARAQVNLPHAEFLDQGNLNKTCTRPVVLAGNCPKTSIYGKAKAWTPLLEKPLEGPVYLVGGYGYKLPALVAELNGQIRVLLVGKVDSGPNKGIRNTFEVVPDAPVSRFVLEMKGGKKYGLLENSEPLCKKPQRAIARFRAQNGLVDQFRPLIHNSCKKKKKSKKRTSSSHRPH